MFTIAELNLMGTISIGVGLLIQGWFILDLNKRITLLMSKIWLENQGNQGYHGLTGMEGNIGLSGLSGMEGNIGLSGLSGMIGNEGEDQ